MQYLPPRPQAEIISRSLAAQCGGEERKTRGNQS